MLWLLKRSLLTSWIPIWLLITQRIKRQPIIGLPVHANPKIAIKRTTRLFNWGHDYNQQRFKYNWIPLKHRFLNARLAALGSQLSIQNVSPLCLKRLYLHYLLKYQKDSKANLFLKSFFLLFLWRLSFSVQLIDTILNFLYHCIRKTLKWLLKMAHIASLALLT